MKKIIALALLVLVMSPTVAFALDTPTTVDVGTFIGAVLTYVQPLILSGVAIVFTFLTSKITPHLIAYLGQQRAIALMAQFDQLLQNGVSSGIALVRNRADQGIKIDARNVIVSEALRYANDHGAAILNNMGKTSDSVVSSIVARLETHPALNKTPAATVTTSTAGESTTVTTVPPVVVPATTLTL